MSRPITGDLFHDARLRLAQATHMLTFIATKLEADGDGSDDRYEAAMALAAVKLVLDEADKLYEWALQPDAAVVRLANAYAAKPARAEEG